MLIISRLRIIIWVWVFLSIFGWYIWILWKNNRRICQLLTLSITKFANRFANTQNLSILCDDSLLCTENGRRIYLHEMHRNQPFCISIGKNIGTTNLHDFDQPWITCTIFCMLMNPYTAPCSLLLNYGIKSFSGWNVVS